MYKWTFKMTTMERGEITITVFGDNKHQAIRNGHEAIRALGLTCTAHWDCKLAKQH